MTVSLTKYQKLDDLVLFVSLMPQPYLNRVQRGAKKIYFFQLPLIGNQSVYYAVDDRPSSSKYITCNRMTGKTAFAEKPSFDAQSSDVVILDVESTDVLPQDLK
jgi:hypothetical protein